MITSILLILSICTFIFYGVVGEDKTWLDAPSLMLVFMLVTVALFSRAAGRRRADDRGRKTEGGEQRETVFRLPVSGLLWGLFLVYGFWLIPQSTVAFESKLLMLFTAGVVGSYWVWGHALASFRTSRPLLGVLIFVVMLCALYGMIIHYKDPEQVLWTTRWASYKGRLMSTYICPNHFAHLMQMLLPFCLVLLFVPRSGLYLKLLSGYSLLAFIPPLFLTESRAGWLGSIAAVGATLLLLALRRSKMLFVSLLVILPLLCGLLLVGGWRFSETFQRRMTPVVTFLQGQAEDGVGSEARDFRPQTWMDTIDMIKEKPWFGYGPGTYHYAYPEFRKRFRGKRLLTGHPHNEYLELTAGFGLIGFGLFALAWLYGLIRILIFSLKSDNPQQALLGIAFLGTAAGTMVHSFFDFQMHNLPNALVFAFLAAVAAAPIGRVRKTKAAPIEVEELPAEEELVHGYRKIPVHGQRAEDKPPVDEEEPAVQPAAVQGPSLWYRCSLVGGNVLGWVLAVGFLGGTLFCAQVMGSAYLRALGERAAAAKDLETARSRLAGAVTLDSSNWRAYKVLGNLAFDDRYYSVESAEKERWVGVELDYFSMAHEKNPRDAEIVNSLGQAHLFAGQTERGLDLLRKACGYRRFNDRFWWKLGIALRDAGQYQEAIEVFEKARSLNNSKAIRKNIEWIKQRLAAQGAEDADHRPDVQAAEESTADAYLLRKGDGLADLLEMMDAKEAQ